MSTTVSIALAATLLAAFPGCDATGAWEPEVLEAADVLPIPTDDEASDYAGLFPLDHFVDVYIDFEGDGWETLLAAPMEDEYVPATITFDGVTVEQVGVRFKGNSSRWSIEEEGGTRYSLKVDIDRYVEGQTLLGVDKINFNNGFHDPTQIREILTTELFAQAGLASPQMGFARIFIDGRLHGAYVSVEQVDKEFLRRHFPDDEGDLYKPEPPAGHLAWSGWDISAYDGMELKTNETTTDHSALLSFLDVLNNTPDEELETALPQVFDVDGFLRYLAVSTLDLNLDSILGPGHNYYLYEDRSTGVFRFIPWDMNSTFGTFTCSLTPPQLVHYPYLHPACPPGEMKTLVARVMAVDSFRTSYQGYLREFSSDFYTHDAVTERARELADVLAPYRAEDPTRFYSDEDLETNLTTDIANGERVFFGITSFVDRRLEQLDVQLGSAD